MNAAERPLPTMREIESARQQLAWVPPDQLIEVVAGARKYLPSEASFAPILEMQMRLHMPRADEAHITATAKAVMFLAHYGV